ncbi:hypothetical protein 278BB001_104 [Bacillus phage 278BB001]|nr:hypothetical protein 010DV004_112 [Bacillus phage 010DV004]QZA69329.1 hypothetical protein 010DV005_112 [Bacillus phage 010DV005]QZA69897.1 hypothetical protein 043JT007_111 [Bacillus phage 043JT007]QZA70255.1 hypothetical protein 278BB001_104 [Bacillus phage 278BB001]UPI12170.1 hypothetical protein [Bacillus phage SBSphiJ2]UPI13168.1 hypothetical protein [Bacillus phage SBSphiJ6]
MSKEFGPDTVVVFSVDTGYVGCDREEKFTLGDLGIIDDGETISADDLDHELQQAYDNWLWDNINCNYYVDEESK